ncbi:DUF2946 domain-containing protein [Lampropedia puyangensis]|uniref:DUF2946 domain-containing protein n=1 Tax=Lampropedia puyangensis TaxID=1330072 RepID=A0A4S8EWN9_9BURK|nr:DUF2946 domain-containing protein [Lampropedia puyangensis]THT98710.1 DUF2946 domain-containing protein [Lampropedia puyangensis]
MSIFPLFRKLTKLVIVWFALSILAATASPIVNPKRIDFLCAEGGAMKVVVVDDQGKIVPIGNHTLDCPNCLLTAPPLQLEAGQTASAFSFSLSRYRAAHIPALSGSALPPRGPPVAL